MAWLCVNMTIKFFSNNDIIKAQNSPTNSLLLVRQGKVRLDLNAQVAEYEKNKHIKHPIKFKQFQYPVPVKDIKNEK